MRYKFQIISILVVLVVRLFKTKFSSYNIFIIAVMIAVILVCHYFGCLDPYSFSYFACLLAVAAREIDEKWKNRKNENKKIESEQKTSEEVIQEQ